MSRIWQPMPSSFRDPSGHVFLRGADLFRQVNKSYQPEFDQLIDSGLYKSLVDQKLLISHSDAPIEYAISDNAYKIIAPERVPFISYPYEWCFSQLREAALLTLQVQEEAIQRGMTLVDSSAFNVQFLGTRPVFIDTLSFRKYEEGTPWSGYKQFCQHFFAPLTLMSYCDARTLKLQQAFIDGIPLDLADSLLPLKAKMNVSLLVHISGTAKAIKSVASQDQVQKPGYKVSKLGLLGILSSLRSSIQGLKIPGNSGKSDWLNYHEFHNYTDNSGTQKANLVEEFLAATDSKIIWDLGSNTGEFSRLVAKHGRTVISADMEHDCVERNFTLCKQKSVSNVHPLIVDLSAPTPAIGWANNERQSFVERGPADAVIALALIHHLAIGNNVPFELLADFFSRCGKHLILEFVAREDSQVQKMLSTREDIFGWYTPENFESTFSQLFTIVRREAIPDTHRTMYLLARKSS